MTEPQKGAKGAKSRSWRGLLAMLLVYGAAAYLGSLAGPADPLPPELHLYLLTSTNAGATWAKSPAPFLVLTNPPPEILFKLAIAKAVSRP